MSDAILGHASVPPSLRHFEPGADAAHRRLDALRPAEYARSRNVLDGAVSGLSPYLSHGVIALPEAVQRLMLGHRLGLEDKLVFEFAWREFFRHVWDRAGRDGDAILADLRPTLPWHGVYAATLPADIREARTGVPAVDTAVRVLYASGYLHNHARMWLASYVVHVRKVHWRAGADWLYGHLLDGDLASNHLSWQWVAGSFSSKPYLFNAANVDKYAPAAARGVWASTGTAIDRSYEDLDTLARSAPGVGPEPGVHAGVIEPTLLAAPPLADREGLPRPDPARWAGRPLELVTPWALSARREPGAWRVGLVHAPAHAAFPWSARRWGWVLSHMAGLCDAVFVGDATTFDAGAAASVHAEATRFPGYRELLPRLASLREPARLFPNPPAMCASFSRFHERLRRQSVSLHALLASTPWPLPTQAPLL